MTFEQKAQQPTGASCTSHTSITGAFNFPRLSLPEIILCASVALAGFGTTLGQRNFASAKFCRIPHEWCEGATIAPAWQDWDLSWTLLSWNSHRLINSQMWAMQNCRLSQCWDSWLCRAHRILLGTSPACCQTTVR